MLRGKNALLSSEIAGKKNYSFLYACFMFLQQVTPNLFDGMFRRNDHTQVTRSVQKSYFRSVQFL
uniref:Uncharacterized protein n=1 Tax=Triticum urartu TaxID=4572 RepID=A0A8R7V789_TRIUA